MGRRIEGVRYVELRYEKAPGPMWPAAGFDSLDFGLELDLDNGDLWSCTWASPGYDYGLLANRETPIASLLSPDADPAVWDVSERWRDLGPAEITAVTPVWTRLETLCQVTIILHSSAGRGTVLTLGAADLDGRFEPSADNVAVFFSIADAQTAGVQLPGDTDPTP
ncbi:hypothetical protein GCM10027569_16510 [Flindersiella endophytica]